MKLVAPGVALVAVIAALVAARRTGLGETPRAVAAPAPTPPVVDASPAVAEALPTLLLEDPVELARLEESGFSLGEVALRPMYVQRGPRASGASELAEHPRWRTMVAQLDRDVAELYGNDKHFGTGMRFTHRGFDVGWLVSPAVRFELVAIVNRVDRRDFEVGGCGELRFVYRAAYTVEVNGQPFSSRLPLTINVVDLLSANGDVNCGAATRAIDDLRTGVKRPARLQKSIEVNIQTSRWPSTVRPDLGGHAEYLMRVFSENAEHRLAPAPLENTPDVARIASDQTLRRRVAEWLRAPSTAEHARRGVVQMPEDFAAHRIVSVTPRGLARLQNRPFTALASALDVNDVDGETLRLLDGLSCNGCHQSKSVAGFHILGAERDPSRVVDTLAITRSPHVDDELKRRRTALLAMLTPGQTPSALRPPAERGPNTGNNGRAGDACGLKLFPDWRCSEGLRCLAVDSDEVGQCAPPEPGVGHACRPGTVDAVRDRLTPAATLACTDAMTCEGIGVGFPGGMCAGECDRDLGDDARCGGIALLTPFNRCLAAGGLFTDCAKHQRPAALAACDVDRPCRPDYVCARNLDGNGVCLPPYFVLQMRLDGHPLKAAASWRSLFDEGASVPRATRNRPTQPTRAQPMP
jgi:hypothetical protein